MPGEDNPLTAEIFEDTDFTAIFQTYLHTIYYLHGFGINRVYKINEGKKGP